MSFKANSEKRFPIKNFSSILLILFTILLRLLKITKQAEYFSNTNFCSDQRDNVVVALSGGKFAILYTCSNVKTSGLNAICYDIKNESTYANIKSGYLTANDSNNHNSVAAETLSNGNVAVVYGEGNTGFLYIFIADSDMNKVLSDRRVMQTSNNKYQTQKIARLVNGKFVVVFGYTQVDGDNDGVVAKIYYNDLRIAKSEFVVNSYTKGDQYSPSVCVLPNGNFVISWDSFNQDGFSNWSVFMQIYNEKGEKISGEINSTNESKSWDEFQPQIACLTNGNILVTWESNNRDANSKEVYGAIFDSTGIQIGSQFRVNTYITKNQSNVGLHALQNGRAAVLWTSETQNDGGRFNDNSGLGVYMQLLNADGTKDGKEIMVNVSTDKDQFNPKITRLNNGAFAISWLSNSAPKCITSNTNLARVLFELWDLDQLVNSYVHDEQNSQDSAALLNGNYVITWHSCNQLNEYCSIYAKIYDKNKKIIKSDFLVSASITKGVFKNPRIVVLNNGFFIILYETDKVVYASSQSILGAKFFEDGRTSLSDRVIINTSGTLLSRLDVIPIVSDWFVLIWSQSTTSIDINIDSYFMVFSSNLTSLSNKLRFNDLNRSQDQLWPSWVVSKTRPDNTNRIFGTYSTNHPGADADGFAVYGILYQSNMVTKIKNEFLINTYQASDQNYSKIVALNNYNFAIFYRSNGIITQGWEIAGKVYDYNGAQSIGEKVLNSYTTGDQYLTGATASNSFIWLIWYGSTPKDLDGYGIAITKLNYDLTLVSEIYVNKAHKNHQFNPNIIKLINSNQIVASWNTDKGDFSTWNKSGNDWNVSFEIFDDCPVNYFADANDEYRCKPCDFACEGCSNYYDYCSSCKLGALRKFDDPNRCFFYAPSGYFLDYFVSLYQKCDLSCDGCIKNSKNCEACAENFFPREEEFNSSNKQCFGFSNSPDGYYFQVDRHMKCDDSCLKCVSKKDNCMQCASEYFSLLGDKSRCFKVCPQSFWKNFLLRECSKCHATCKTCLDDSKFCETCIDGLYQIKETRECLEKCPEGYIIPDGTFTCIKCSPVCKTCESKEDKCTSCFKTFFFYDEVKTCTNKCPEGLYGDVADNTCKTCDKSCLTCKGRLDSECLSCPRNSGLKLQNGFCVKDNSGVIIQITETEQVMDVKNCFEILRLTVPKIFNIEGIDFKSSLFYKLKVSCEKISNDIKISWKPVPNAILSTDKLRLDIPSEKLKDGNLVLSVDIFYLDNFILNISENSNLITNKLVPVIKNEESLIFLYDLDIEIDASLSYDEGSVRVPTFKTPQEPLAFNWSCPQEFKTLCSASNNSTLVIKASNYLELISEPEENKIFSFSLTIRKDRRYSSKTFQVTLRKRTRGNNNAENKKPLNFEELIVIESLSAGRDAEQVFRVFFLDKSLDLLEYRYYWTVTHFKKDSQYLNSRKELFLKILNDDLLTGDNQINIEVTDKSEKTYYKTYIFEKARAPYGGNCLVNPFSGISMKTNFKFTFENWKSKSLPLLYKLKYINTKINIYLDISKGGFFENYWSSNLIPISNSLMLEVTDSSGLSSVFPCAIRVKANSDLLPLDDYLNAEFDIFNRLLLVEVYKSNKENLIASPNQKKENEEYFSNLNKVQLNLVKDFLTDSPENIQLNIEDIIAKILEISKQNLTKESFLIVVNSTKIIVDNIDPLLQYIHKIKNVYQILDNILNRANNVEELKSDKDLLSTLQDSLKELNSKLFTNAIDGQTMVIVNENYTAQIVKVSKLNVPKISLDYESDSPERVLFEIQQEKKKIRNSYSLVCQKSKSLKKTKIRLLQSQSQNDLTENDQKKCSDSIAAICIPAQNITNIIKTSGGTSLGFQGQLNNNKENLPIEQPQFSNSLDFELLTQEKGRKLMRKLNSDDLNIQFEIRLKMPVQKDSREIIHEATCVQYTSKKPDTSCESWYDLSVNEVVCSCSKQGLTVNVVDKLLSNFSKFQQFPLLSADLFNGYSISIVGMLISLFVIFISIAIYKDIQDNKSYINMDLPGFDLTQFYIIRFNKEGFGGKVIFSRLFSYFVKNLHPILSILQIYDPNYNRKIRIIDFFFNIYITFFFTLLPFYITDNSQLIEMAANRSIENRNKSVKDLGVALKQILQSVLFSVCASVATGIVTFILSSLFYENIILKESNKKKKFALIALRKINPESQSIYAKKLRTAYVKIRSLMIITKLLLHQLKKDKYNDELKNQEKNLKMIIPNSANMTNKNEIDSSGVQNINNIIFPDEKDLSTKKHFNTQKIPNDKDIEIINKSLKMISHTCSDSNNLNLNDKENFDAIEKENSIKLSFKSNNYEKSHIGNNLISRQQSDKNQFTSATSYLSKHKAILNNNLKSSLTKQTTEEYKTLEISKYHLFDFASERIQSKFPSANSIDKVFTNEINLKENERKANNIELDVSKSIDERDSSNNDLIEKIKKEEKNKMTATDFFNDSEHFSSFKRNETNYNAILNLKLKKPKQRGLKLRNLKNKLSSNHSLKNLSSTSGLLNKSTSIKFIREGKSENNSCKEKDQMVKEEACSIKMTKVSYINTIKEISNLDESNVSKDDHCDLKISKEVETSYKGNMVLLKKPEKMVFELSKRTFSIPCHESSVYTCFKISILVKENKIINNRYNMRLYLKIFLIGMLNLILWLYIAIFIESIYKQFGDNIFKICFMPLISMLIVKFLIVENLKLFLTTVILFYKGKTYINTKKNGILITLVFKALLHPLALDHFHAILYYRDFLEFYQKN